MGMLCLLFGITIGYVFAGDWVAKLYCGYAPYYQCLCNGPDGETAATCPISSLAGGLGGAYLAATSDSEIAGVNGAMTVLCGNHPTGIDFDPYVAMVDAVGEAKTHAYLEQLHSL